MAAATAAGPTDIQDQRLSASEKDAMLTFWSGMKATPVDKTTNIVAGKIQRR
jgi:hypothetical protein